LTEGPKFHSCYPREFHQPSRGKSESASKDDAPFLQGQNFTAATKRKA